MDAGPKPSHASKPSRWTALSFYLLVFILCMPHVAAHAQTTLSATAIDFGGTTVGQVSVVHRITFTNTQSVALSISSLTVSGSGYALDASTTCGHPGTLAAGRSCLIGVTLTPAALGPASAGTLTIATNAANSPQTVSLSGTGVAQTTLFETAVAFGNVAVNQASAVHTVLFRNDQSVPLTITSLQLPSGGYAFATPVSQSPQCPASGSLGPGITCAIGLTLTPAALGPVPAGVLSIASSADTSPQTVALSGTGVVPVTLSASAINFGSTAVEEASVVHRITLTNNQSAVLSLSSLAVSGDGYSLDPSTTCGHPGTLAGGASCVIGVTLTPTSVGLSLAGALTITTNANNSPQTVALSGMGVSQTTVFETSIAFGNVAVNQASAVHTILYRNNQAIPLTISALQLPAGGYAFATPVSQSPVCPASGTLAAGTTCAIGLTLTPTVLGAVAAGSLNIVSSADNSPQTVALSGTGVVPVTLSATAIGFGGTTVGQVSVVHRITLTNNQSAMLSILSLQVSGSGYALDPSTTCGDPGMLAAGASCLIGVTLTPSVQGPAAAGVLTVVTNAANSPQAVALSGTGVTQTTLFQTSVAFGNVAINEASAVHTVLFRNNQSVPLMISSLQLPSGSGYAFATPISQSPQCPASGPLGAGITCAIGLTLTPAALGPVPAGVLSIASDALVSPQTVTLSGAGVVPVIPSVTSVTFPAQFEGVTSVPQTVTFTNQQVSALVISSLVITGPNAGDFAATNLCTGAVSVNAVPICSVLLTFTPTGTGTRTATLTINDGAQNAPLTITLSGQGNAPLIVSPTAITTYSAPVGTTSAYQTVSIMNATMAQTFHISALQLTGDFKQTSTTCGSLPYAIVPGASCNVTISFAPTVSGTRTGELQVVDDAVTSPQVVNLSGTGTSPITLSPASLTYTAQKLGTLSVPQNVTLTNYESQQETFTLTPSANFTATSICTDGVIRANSSCAVSVVFAPAATATPGPITGTLTVTDSATGAGPLYVSLIGSATTLDPPAAVAVVSPAAAAAGAVVPVTITGNGLTHFSNASTIKFTDTDNSLTSSGITYSITGSSSPNSLNATLTIDTGAVSGARDIEVDTPLAGGGTETALLNSAFLITAPSNVHTITAVNPSCGNQGQTLNVDLTFSGMNFVAGTSYAIFGDGITVNSLAAGATPNDVVASISISNTTPVGGRTVTLVTGGDFATSTFGACQVGANNATLLSVTPNSEPQGFSGSITLTSSGTHFLQNATTVSIGGGVIVGDVNVSTTTPTTATAEVTVPANASIGAQDVTVATGGEIATLAGGFTVVGATPLLLSETPNSAQQGQTLNVTITGNAYTNFLAGVTAQFGGEIQVNGYSAISANSVTVNITVSQNASAGSITANLIVGPTGNQQIFPFSFTVTPSSAAIVNVVPGGVPQGGQLTLAVTGRNTHWVQGATMATFIQTPYCGIAVNVGTFPDTTDGTLNVSVPANCPVGGYTLQIATGGEVVSATVQVYANTPSVAMNPSSGLPGTSFTVTFTGDFTHFSSSTTAVVSGEGVTLSPLNLTPGQTITATITIAADAPVGGRTITLTTGTEVVTTGFEVSGTSISVLSPYEGPQSTTQDIVITGVNTHFVQGTTTVLFGPQITVNSVTVISPTELTVNITTSYLLNGTLTATPPGWQSLYVKTGSEEETASFLILAPLNPSILNVDPSSAAQGSTVTVTITGSLTNWVQGVTEAILGSGVTVNSLTINGPTTATASLSISPTASLGTNSVVMITGSEIEIGGGFTVTPGAANVVSVEPPGSLTQTGVWVVSQLQTSTLKLTAVGTHWVQGETTVNFGPGVAIDELTVINSTTATVQITVLSSAPVGFATLTVVTDGEVVSFPQALDIEEGFASLLSTSPGGGQQGATLNLQVLGRFTHWQQGVTTAAFSPAGDITVNSFTVVDSENGIINLTVNPTAYVDTTPYCDSITITTGSEQVTLPPPGQPGQFCIQQGPAQIMAVSPATGLQGTTGTVTITGGATNFAPGITQVSFNDPGISVGTVTVTSPTSLTVPVSISTTSLLGYHTVTATTLGETASQQFAYQVNPNVATLNEAIPNSAVQGAPLTGQSPLVVRLIGQYSHFSAESTAVFGAGITVQSVSFVSLTEIDATIVIDPLSYIGVRNVTVTTPNVPCAELTAGNACRSGATIGSEIVSAGVFSVATGPAIISTVAPGTGNQGQEVVFMVTGSGTHWQQNFTQFWMDGIGQDLTVNSVVINNSTSATVDMTISPTAVPGARTVSMVTAGEALSDAGAFVVTGGIPVITYLSPNSANPGTSQLLVTINGLDTMWDSTSTVDFGPGITVTSYQVDDPTHIEAVINIDAAAQIGYRTVVVTTGAQKLTGNFLVAAPAPPPTPYISFYYPYSGLTGQTLTIQFTGQFTHWDPGPINTPTTATFGDGIAVNTFQVTSPTSAVATVTIDRAAVTGQRLIVFTTGSEMESVPFSVVSTTPGTPGSVVPVLSLVDPGSAIQGAQNLLVTILGQYTAFDSTTTFSLGPGITVNGPPMILGSTVARQSISIGQEAATGGYTVTSNTPGAPAGAQTAGGAVFYVTPSLALVSAVTPNIAKQGDTVTVEVSGQNTHWDATTVFQFGAGITVSQLTVNSATDATMTLSIPALASLGPTSVTAQTAGEVAALNNGFVVQAGTPLLLSSGPNSLPQQSSATFTILSQATNWTAANPPAVTYGSGVTVTNVNVTSATSLTAFGYIQPTTNLGYRDLTVTSGNQVLGLPNALYVTAGPAAINGVSPSSGGQGANLTAVQIMGTNTNWQQGVTSLSFPEVLVNSFTVSSPTLITANITVNQSATPGQVSVTATTGGEVATETNAFTVIQTDAELLNANPNSGAQGLTENVTLAGFYSHFGANSVVSFGQGVTVNSVTANSSTSLTANITVQPTAAIGSRTVAVTTGTESVSLMNGFQVTTGQAAILSLSPASGAQNTNVIVQVTGSQTSFASGETTAAVGGGITVTGVTVADPKHASLNLSIPGSTATGSYNVTLTTGGEVATILGGFTVTAGTPQVSSVSPATGHQGDTNLSIGLTGLFTHFANGTSTASFGTGITVNSLTVTDATDAVANITISPSAAVGSRTVTVTTGSESASITGGFSVLAGLPALSSAMPGTAQAGATANVVVTGAFTNFQQGSTTVSFGAGVTVNSVTVSSSTQLSANVTVDPNATVGSRDIAVTTGTQTVVLSGGFTVTPGTPVVTVINPNIGVPGSVVSVTINGLYTNWDPGTTKVAFGPGITVGSGVAGGAGPVASGSANSIVVNLSIDPAAALGPRDVTITTGSEVETVAAGFTVQATTVTPPTVISVSPAGNAVAVSTNSSVYAVFSQPMDRTTITTSNVLLYLTSNPGGNIAVPGSVSVDASGRELTFTPAAALAVNASYYFVITNGVADASGNALGYYTSYFYTGFSASTTSPTVVLANPPVGAGGIGTNVSIQVEFSAQMNQATQAGLTVTAGGVAVPGSYTWSNNSYTLYNGYYYYYGNYACGYSYYYYYNDPSYAATCPNQGSVVTFTPSAPLLPDTTYTVGYAATLADTAGNALRPGSFTFSTGAGADTAYNGSGPDFTNYATNVGTNFAPTMNFAKPVDPLAINAGTLYLYNVDGNKYILGKVTLAADAMSATFTPSMPLLPNTQYDFHMSGGYFDVDGNYLDGTDSYFTTGAGAEIAPPQVSSVFPADLGKAVPLNAQVVFHFSEPLDPNVTPTVQITPNGGAAIAGTATLASDQVTLTFVPAMSLAPGTQFTAQVSHYQDMVGNVGAAFSSSFTTATSVAPLSVSTGIDASGNLITTGDTVDPHWTAINSNSPNPQPVDVVTPANVGWYSGWPANGPMSSWITVSPDAVPGPINSTYSTTFNLTGYSLSNLCLAGFIESDPYGTLLLNGNAITPQLYPFAYNGYGPYPLSIALPVADLNTGVNTLSYQFSSNYSGYEGLRIQASVQTCGATLTGGLTLTSSDPVNGAGGVPTNASVTLTFNNPIDPATVNSSTIPVEINGIYDQVVAGNYTVNGNQVVFTPDSPFPVGTALYVNACPGLNDLAGDSYPYCQTVDAFTTAGTATPVTPVTPPFQVIAFAPAANAGNVGLRAPVVATFNRSVNPNTVNTNGNTDFALFQGDGQSPWCTTYMKSQDNATLQFSCGALPASSLMTASLNGGLQDFSGNSLANFTSQFTSSQADSSTAGSLSGARPGTGSSGVSPNAPLVLFFNLPVNASGANTGLQVAQNNVAITGSVQVLDNGYTLQFTPSTPFVAGALIQWSTTSSLTDSTYGNLLSPASGYFTIAADTSAATPVVQVVSPALYTSIAPNSTVDIQFNVPLNPSTVNSTNVYLYDTVAGVNVAATYSQPQPNVVRIVPQANLTASATIYLYATNGLQSTTSVPFGGSAYLGYFYTLAVPDTTSPTVVSAVPYSGAPGVGVNVQPGFVFSKPIDPISVNASTFQVLNGTTALPGSYWVSSDDTRIEFVPNSPLPVSATLTMSLTGVQDQVGNPLSYTSHFTTGATPDEIAPVVVQTSIPSNATVPINSNITVQFSESMDVTTFNATDFRLYDDDSTSYGTVASTLTWNSAQSVAYLVPAAPLKAGHQYTLYVNSGTDLAGNGMQSYSSYFYAGFASDAAAPSVTAFSPLAGATGVGTNTVIDVAFSAPIDPTTLSGVTLSAGGTTVPSTAVLAGGNTVVQLVPQAPLTANTKYVVTIAGVKDPAGNMVATATNSFTTGATFNLTAATVVSVDPPNYPPVGTNVTPRVTFSKPLNPVFIANSSFSMYLVDTAQFIPLTVALSRNGLQVTLTPQIALLPNTEYRFNGNGGIYDQDGNAVSGGYYYFYTGDGAVTSSLTVTGVSPTAGATAVPLNAQIAVTVSATLDPTSVTQSSLQLLDSSSHAVPGTVSQTDGQTLTFVPTANLLADAAYTVKTGSFTDANGNAVVPYASGFSTGATAAATGGLTLISSNIANGAGNVSTTQPVTLVFSQVINAETVNANTFLVTVNGSTSYNLAGNFAVNGNTVTFTPANPYPAGAVLFVYGCGITDVLGEVLSSACNQLLNFTVTSGSVDTTPLQILSVSPAKGAVNVGLEHSVSVTFNKSINPGSVRYASNGALLYAGQNLVDNGSLSFSADNRTLYFNTGSLQSGVVYTIEFPAGGVSDYSGNALTSNFISSFTTSTDPVSGTGTVVGTSPGNGATGVPDGQLLTLYVNRPVDASTLNGNFIVTVNGQVQSGTAQALANGYEVQFTPSSPYPDGAAIEWYFTNVQDIYGNTFNSDSGYFYVAVPVDAATAPPQVVATSPFYGSSTVPVNVQLDIEYSQPIDPATLNNINGYYSNFPASTYSLPTPNVLRVTPTSALSPSTYYYLCVNGLVGTNGVPAANACYAGTFTTVSNSTPDTTAGTVSIGPPNGSVNVGTNAYIRLQFSKPVDQTTVNSANVQITAGGVAIPGTWSYNNSAGDVIGAYFSPLNPLPASSTILVKTSGMLDYAGNTFSVAQSQFTTAAMPDYTTPVVALDFPYDTTGIGTNAKFTCRYSQAIDPASITSSGTYLYDYAASAKVPVTYSFSSDLMSVTMTPTSALAANSNFYYYCNYAIDLTGNGQSGGSVYFTTGSGPSSTGPTLVQVNPPNGFTNVPLNSNGGPFYPYTTSLQVQFSEPVAESSLGGLTLTPNGGSPIPISPSAQDADTIVSVQLPSVLLPNTTYTLNVSGVADYNGNLITPVTSSFTTGTGYDFVNPTVSAANWTSVSATTPTALNGASGVDDNPTLSLVFSEPMDPVLIDGSHIYLQVHNTQTLVPATLKLSPDYATVYLAPSSPLAAATIYDLVTENPYWNLTDIAGNNYSAQGVVATFTTQ
ncbi:Ig-like domain-containing protein [Granulicella aggregans]|uniref:Ig-like domain-containing protein n=1 Tax=Granulicella aggregans TaxID=474949 RepID=UPI0021DF564C|nr:Ig-like domain-containing protein [Granulicella aggregans]